MLDKNKKINKNISSIKKIIIITMSNLTKTVQQTKPFASEFGICKKINKYFSIDV